MQSSEKDGVAGRRVASDVVLAALAALACVTGCGREEGAGEVTGRRLPQEVVRERAAVQAEITERVAREADAASDTSKQILFGDLHVHSTFSIDAFMMSLPFMQGEGAHPVSDACDFARYCSSLDFWSINDHAESLTPLRWRQTKDAIRQCNEVAGDPDDPDLVSFLGWEWTQVGRTPETHYGHKNVIFKDTADDEVPRRPIHSAGFTYENMRRPTPLRMRVMIPLLDPTNAQRYWNLNEFQRAVREVPECDPDTDTRELPAECTEGTSTPAGLFRKLDEWGFDSLVIPHGTTWWIYTPRGSSWDKQLTAEHRGADRQSLIEVFSGHGNSEQYRSWRSVEIAADGSTSCPEPVDGYEPCCWRAGEIIRARCEDPGSDDCEARVEKARRIFLDAGTAGRVTIPDAELADWGDCGSCTDCFLGSMTYRPASSVQYTLALSNFDDAADSSDPNRFHFGFMASSDNHRARPGTGYKQYGRLINTEAHGPSSESWYERMYGELVPPAERMKESQPVDSSDGSIIGFRVVDFEREASFFMTGGLTAVHSAGRSRDAIWDALGRREVYGTSGERMLLWFDLVNGRDGEVAMGRKVDLGVDPRFRVRAAGSLKQKAGCPESTSAGLDPERLEKLCRGECYNPGDERYRIERVEVVRIRPQKRPGEPVEDLIEDPWRVFDCSAGDDEGCVVEFTDPEYRMSGRDTTYYVRAIQEPQPRVNGGHMRCEYDEQGLCIKARPCYGDYRTPKDDACLEPAAERAWSSPIYLTYDR